MRAGPEPSLKRWLADHEIARWHGKIALSQELTADERLRVLARNCQPSAVHASVSGRLASNLMGLHAYKLSTEFHSASLQGG